MRDSRAPSRYPGVAATLITLILLALPDVPARAQVTVAGREKGQTWLRVVLREGRKRQIRRVAAMLGCPVHRLIRVRIGPLRLGDLKPREWRRLTDAEVQALRAAVAGERRRPRQKRRKNKGRG